MNLEPKDWRTLPGTPSRRLRRRHGFAGTPVVQTAHKNGDGDRRTTKNITFQRIHYGSVDDFLG